MITQVGAACVCPVVKDPRRTAKRIQFKNKPEIPYKGDSETEYEKQQKSAFKTNIAIIISAVAFMMGYFFLSGLERARK